MNAVLYKLIIYHLDTRNFEICIMSAFVETGASKFTVVEVYNQYEILSDSYFHQIKQYE